ncbi:MAG TPA: hypothetical protein VF173_19525 [Thermoanaerobaculia bacterium]|nr:hypothetical protein [Thermoanaerobaculia bacterium]
MTISTVTPRSIPATPRVSVIRDCVLGLCLMHELAFLCLLRELDLRFRRRSRPKNSDSAARRSDGESPKSRLREFVYRRLDHVINTATGTIIDIDDKVKTGPGQG